jgi:ABC-type transporter Mla subunit MlaD
MSYLFSMSDRSLGYILIILLALFLGASSAYFIWLSFIPVETRVIAFGDIGSLKIDDPVKLRGFDIGRVGDIQWKDRMVYVTVELKNPLDLYEHYYISIVDKGVMGDRYITILRGDTTGIQIPAHDTLDGRFIIGPSQAIGYAYKLKQAIKDYAELSSQLLHGTDSRPSLPALTFDILDYADSVSTEIIIMLSALNRDISGQVETFLDITDSAAAYSRILKQKTPQWIEAINELLHRVNKLAGTMEEVVVLLDKLIQWVQKAEEPGAEALIEDIGEQLHTLRRLIDKIRVNGIELTVQPRIR